MKRSPLKHKSSTVRGEPRAPMRKTKYARRERDFDRMAWTKRQVCMLHQARNFDGKGEAWQGPADVGWCSGLVEAHHAGERAGWQKADDATVVPLCRSHHAELTDRRGPFAGWPRGALKVWELAAVAYYTELYTAHLASVGETLY